MPASWRGGSVSLPFLDLPSYYTPLSPGWLLVGRGALANRLSNCICLRLLADYLPLNTSSIGIALTVSSLRWHCITLLIYLSLVQLRFASLCYAFVLRLH